LFWKKVKEKKEKINILFQGMFFVLEVCTIKQKRKKKYFSPRYVLEKEK